jgi:hypothetical protein
MLDNAPVRCNQPNPLLSGLLASGPNLKDTLVSILTPHLRVPTAN